MEDDDVTPSGILKVILNFADHDIVAMLNAWQHAHAVYFEATYCCLEDEEYGYGSEDGDDNIADKF